MDKFTHAEQMRIKMINKIQEMKNIGYSISKISRLLDKDSCAIKKYIQGESLDLCKHSRKIHNPYEKRVINLIEIGNIEKQIVEILISDGYKLSRSNARHMIRKVIKIISKYELFSISGE